MKLQRSMSLPQGLLSLKGCSSLELTVALAEAPLQMHSSVADRTIQLLSLFSILLPALLSRYYSWLFSKINFLYSNMSVWNQITREERVSMEGTPLYFLKCPGLEAALLTVTHIAIAGASVLTTCACKITEKYTTSVEYPQKRREIVITATVAMWIVTFRS